MPKYKPVPVILKRITPGNVEKTALGLRNENAVPTFAPISRALPGFFKRFFAIFFDTLSPFLPKFLKKSPKSTATIVLSETLRDVFL